ncbi:TetR/AcrR family transcriptional regulator [Bailinhaonella thermotolerans]|uniref:TetR/AcrR family transcriptional regulator n=1 Tax=Bailinhaonella thermotolerans TaxID=1070861 RepID=A0A3A4B3E6_9ACTN|nr:TetR/AcrR family transcriptional regulator [Bailinhaonella thermotolerans]RJL32559.1 TetR/AcrR family transcriptional regulator [Bailinhaonella thermotolerans]
MNDVKGATVRSPGRPRSERAERAIIEATLDLFAEVASVSRLSIEAVAARAGVGKTTIYRRWPNKEALLIDALATIKPPPPEVAGESVREDLLTLMRVVGVHRGDDRLGCIMRIVQAEAEKHPEFMRDYRHTVMAPHRQALMNVLRRGVESGELRADLDLDLAHAAIVGALLYRNRAAWHDAPAPPDYPEVLLDALLRGFAPPA